MCYYLQYINIFVENHWYTYQKQYFNDFKANVCKRSFWNIIERAFETGFSKAEAFDLVSVKVVATQMHGTHFAC